MNIFTKRESLTHWLVKPWKTFDSGSNIIPEAQLKVLLWLLQIVYFFLCVNKLSYLQLIFFVCCNSSWMKSTVFGFGLCRLTNYSWDEPSEIWSACSTNQLWYNGQITMVCIVPLNLPFQLYNLSHSDAPTAFILVFCSSCYPYYSPVETVD